MTEEKQEKKGPFSPLQTGCAFIMLTNMLIYLGVVLFVFNLLDPSKIDELYLSKRMFASPSDRETEKEKSGRRLSAKKRLQQQKIQSEMLDTAGRTRKMESSTAGRLSTLESRELSPALPSSPEYPKAALTEGSSRVSRSGTKSAQTRSFSVSVFPQATMRRLYSPYSLSSPKTLSPEQYNTLPIEMAPGIEFPSFSPPAPDRGVSKTYTPSSGLPATSHGGPNLKVPSTGASPQSTNETDRVEDEKR